MAAHSAQGPRLGVPQLVQSRAQFGFYGALLPNAAIWLLLLSTLVAADVTAGGTLAGLWHISLAQGVMVVCFVAWLLAVFGYRILHNASRVRAVAALIMAGVLLGRLAQRLGGAPAGPTVFDVSTVRRSLPASGRWRARSRCELPGSARSATSPRCCPGPRGWA
jgi:nucleobase:cation symporter-1, NCS1 family